MKSHAHKLPFTTSDLIIILEAARLAFNDADNVDDLAVTLDLTDEEITSLRDRLQSYMAGGAK